MACPVTPSASHTGRAWWASNTTGAEVAHFFCCSARLAKAHGPLAAHEGLVETVRSRFGFELWAQLSWDHTYTARSMPCRGAPLQSRVLQLILVLLVTAPWRAEALLSRRTPHSCDCPPPEPVASKGLPESPHRHPERAQPSSKQAHKIPRLVHQCWFPEATPLPARYLAWQRTWVTKHPEWEFWQWSDVSNRALVAR